MEYISPHFRIRKVASNTGAIPIWPLSWPLKPFTGNPSSVRHFIWVWIQIDCYFCPQKCVFYPAPSHLAPAAAQQRANVSKNENETRTWSFSLEPSQLPLSYDDVRGPWHLRTAPVEPQMGLGQPWSPRQFVWQKSDAHPEKFSRTIQMHFQERSIVPRGDVYACLFRCFVWWWSTDAPMHSKEDERFHWDVVNHKGDQWKWQRHHSESFQLCCRCWSCFWLVAPPRDGLN